MNGLADDCYKFGAGRFVMRRGLLEEIGGELRYYGENPYFVGGPTAMALARPRLCATAGRRRVRLQIKKMQEWILLPAFFDFRQQSV